MEILGPEKYQLRFDSKKFVSICAKGTGKFSGLAARKGPKIYIVSVSNELIYVGATTRKMRDRLRDGWSAAGETGYYGYRWRHEMAEADLDIWFLENPLIPETAKDVETIEAEVVHLIRCDGQWPRYQTEIHFHCSNNEHRALATRIYSHYRP